MEITNNVCWLPYDRDSGKERTFMIDFEKQARELVDKMTLEEKAGDSQVSLVE